VRRRRLLAALLPALVIGSSLSPGLTMAQGTDDLDAVTLALDPVGEGIVTGLAVLSPRDGDTAANVLAVGAPAGAVAVIHAGTCAAIDPTPVGLLGDVGTTGQLAATVPVAYASIVDGAHVVAFHPGLDLATTLACGVIPVAAASAATAGPGASTSPAGDRFQSPTYGFSIDWDAPWQRLDWDPGEGYEGVSLSDGTATVSVIGFELAGGDATACIRDWEGRLLGLLRGGTVADLQPVVDDQGQPVGGGDAERAVGSYRYLYKTQADPEGTVIVEQDECRRLDDGAVLEITSDIPLDARDTQTPMVDALIAGIRTDGPVVPSSAAPATAVPATAQPSTAPTPAPSAVPTADTACVGVEAWVTDTLSRFDAVKTMGDSLNTAMNAGMAAYAQTLADTAVAIQQLQIQQQQVSVPASATDAQASVIKLLQKLAEAYDLMAQAYTTGNTGLLQQGLSAASEAQGLATTARTAVRNVATPCGITVPAA
jgi:hypothetical protein